MSTAPVHELKTWPAYFQPVWVGDSLYCAIVIFWIGSPGSA